MTEIQLVLVYTKYNDYAYHIIYLCYLFINTFVWVRPSLHNWLIGRPREGESDTEGLGYNTLLFFSKEPFCSFTCPCQARVHGTSV